MQAQHIKTFTLFFLYFFCHFENEKITKCDDFFYCMQFFPTLHILATRVQNKFFSPPRRGHNFCGCSSKKIVYLNVVYLSKYLFDIVYDWWKNISNDKYLFSNLVKPNTQFIIYSMNLIKLFWDLILLLPIKLKVMYML